MANYSKRPNREDDNFDEAFEKEISETVHAVGDAVQTVVTAVSEGVKDGLREGAKRAASTAKQYSENTKRANNGSAPYESQTANNVGYNYSSKHDKKGKSFFDNTFGKKKPDYAKKARSEKESAGGLALVCGILAVVAVNISGIGSAIVGFISLWFGASMVLSIFRSGKYSRIAMCVKTLGDRTNCAVSEIASAIGKSDRDTVKLLRRCITDGTFSDVFITPDNKRLFASETAYNIYVDQLEKNYKKEQQNKTAEKAPEQPKPTDEPKTVIDECREFYDELKHQNELIDDAAVTEQVDKIEKHMQTLIAYLAKNPDKSPRVKRFTSYYLPTTVRLLETYNEVEPNSDENTVAANIQTDIVGILYTINKAFNTLENGLMEDTALNVSAEISAMQAMLAQDGLYGDDFKTTR